jgi:malonate-semialdehyde dehydrogenase (acetylating) / methylmalonate-semialdehyde dehydrogenase
MSSVVPDVPGVPILAGPHWKVPRASSFGAVHNPSSAAVIAQVPMCSAVEVDEAVQAAATAFVSWAKVPVVKRAAVLFRYKAVLEDHFEELAALVTRENGKTREEARGDVRRGIEVVDFACGIAQLNKGEALPQLTEEIDAITMREPIGVCAGITPFNFPAMVPLWMFPIAIACGNTFLLKPSEKVPLTAVRLAELALQAGLPPGVLNVVHGGREAVDAILEHPVIVAVSFVGSTGVAKHVYVQGCKHGKRVQAAGGAKNVMLVMPDAAPDPTIRAIMGAAYGCAGQRCMAGSILLAVGDAGDHVSQRLGQAIDALLVDDTLANPDAQMGPLIDGQAQHRVNDYIAAGQKEGARLVGPGTGPSSRQIPGTGFFVRPTLFDAVQPEMKLFRDEIFGPVLSMARPRDLAEAIAWANRSAYGNGAVIFTSSGEAARQFAREIRCGMVGVNVGVPAPMALFSFSGWGQSFFGDLHVQGTEGVMFYTRQKIVLSRWDPNYVRTQGW